MRLVQGRAGCGCVAATLVGVVSMQLDRIILAADSMGSLMVQCAAHGIDFLAKISSHR